MNRRFFFPTALAWAVFASVSSFAATPTEPSAGKTMAVARSWRGRTLASKADEYERYLNASGIAKIRAAPGNLGVTVLRRTDGDQAEFLVMSIWESIEAVKNFAGADYQKAVILPRDREYLLKVEPDVLHFEIVREERAGAAQR